jgi:hypothetical protein
MIVTIRVLADEVRSAYPEVRWSTETIFLSLSEARKQAIENVKGACLHALGDRAVVPNRIEFRVVGVCTHCDKILDGDFACCASCADERGP